MIILTSPPLTNINKPLVSRFQCQMMGKLPDSSAKVDLWGNDFFAQDSPYFTPKTHGTFTMATPSQVSPSHCTTAQTSAHFSWSTSSRMEKNHLHHPTIFTLSMLDSNPGFWCQKMGGLGFPLKKSPFECWYGNKIHRVTSSDGPSL